ncbi:MAG: tRNA (N(6)-L-threonylcarbamoyladenosine(37)-C(2))-methylthiotransferase MtaB [Defluviitaleaceae bacterium]|nr:tRNA (N(6)-L-threonylcarbamoyladenosine(37)-C(2))-methylthiotransferase MtaB [Defluviitaleaceae bacterium]
MRKKVASITLGCKVNDYDTKAMLARFGANGYEIEDDFSSFADIYLINTCTVTSLGDRKSRQMIRRAKTKNPNAIVIAAGCYSQTAPEDVADLEEVNIVIGNKDRNNIVEIVENYDIEKNETYVNVENIRYEKIFEELKIKSMGEKTRAFLKIQEGCNEFCSYCIIPYSRGNNRSRNFTNIINEAIELAATGYKEVVLTGIHIASYGKDLKNTTLAELIKEIHNIDNIERIRLSSIEPMVITDKFLNTISTLPKVCDHFHLSLQSGCDKILKSMNRKYTTTEFKRSVKMLREVMPNVGLTTDVIVGFPGETEMDFANTVAFIEEIGFASMHIFPFSSKKGTRAYNFKEQISPQSKANRAKLLKQIERELRHTFLQKFINKELNVLFENETENGIYEGYSTNYIKIESKTDELIKNKIKNVILTQNNTQKGIGLIV